MDHECLDAMFVLAGCNSSGYMLPSKSIEPMKTYAADYEPE